MRCKIWKVTLVLQYIYVCLDIMHNWNIFLGAHSFLTHDVAKPIKRFNSPFLDRSPMTAWPCMHADGQAGRRRTLGIAWLKLESGSTRTQANFSSWVRPETRKRLVLELKLLGWSDSTFDAAPPLPMVVVRAHPNASHTT